MCIYHCSRDTVLTLLLLLLWLQGPIWKSIQWLDELAMRTIEQVEGGGSRWQAVICRLMHGELSAEQYCNGYISMEGLCVRRLCF